MLDFLRRELARLKPRRVVTTYDVTIFVMSEGTAQGTPRPLQVLKTQFTYDLPVDRYSSPASFHIEADVASIARRGYTHALANGKQELYTPRTIYKIQYEVANDS